MSHGFDLLKSEVIDAGLCTRCGTCVGVCPGNAIEFTDLLGECLPASVGDCTDCGDLCYEACPGRYVSFPKLNDHLFGGPPRSPLLGHYQAIYVGHATDPVVRQAAASGGVVSAVLGYLLSRREVSGAVVLAPAPGEPWRPQPVIARTVEEVIAAAQSKYVLSPVNAILKDVMREPGECAYVGLPDQVHALRKLEMKGHPVTAKIKYVIGLYCGATLYFESVRSFLARNGVRDVRDVVEIRFREGDWPGHMVATLRDGRSFSLPKFHANYLIPFYICQRDLYTIDLTNEFADFSVGDGWSPVYEDRGLGWSVVVARTERGANLLQGLQKEGVLSLTEIGEADAINMHSHGLDFRKRGAFIRMGWRRGRGRPVPEYGIEPEPGSVTWQRRALEAAISSLFYLCSRRVSRWLVNLMPVSLVGRSFMLARVVWKRMTRLTKRHGLKDLTFRLTGRP